MDLFTYKCKLIKVIDGDTFDCVVDLGFRIYRQERIRLYGINAPETHKPTYDEGQAAKKRLEELLPEVFILETYKDSQEKYGRFLGTPYTDDGTNICDKLVEEGFAVAYLP